MSILSWYTQPWVKELFEENPSVLSISEREQSSGPFRMNFCIVVTMADGKVRHRYVEEQHFNKWWITSMLGSLHEGGPSTFWLEDIPYGVPFKHIINASGHSQHSARRYENGLPVEDRSIILAEHGAFMLSVFESFDNITHIGKRANFEASPNTFMFVRKNKSGVSGVTWMASPTLDRLILRLKSSRDRSRWALYEEDGKDRTECSHVFTRAEIFAAVGVKDTSLKKQEVTQIEPAVEAPAYKCCLCDGQVGRYKFIEINGGSGYGKNHYCDVCMALSNLTIVERLKLRAAGAPALPATLCTGCGCSLKTNQAFIGGVCGECELKHETECGTKRTVNTGLVFVRRKVYIPPPKQPSKFDPRPGIDDVGLGFSSPSWEY